MTSGDSERSKHAKLKVVYLGWTSQGHRRSTNSVPFEKLCTTFC